MFIDLFCYFNRLSNFIFILYMFLLITAVTLALDPVFYFYYIHVLLITVMNLALGPVFYYFYFLYMFCW